MNEPGPIVFFGTPAFAVPTLEALCEAGMSPALVVTQPARAVGRGRRLTEPPVAVRARQLELPVELVQSVKTDEFHLRVSQLEPWAGIVVAFGQIFPQSLLDIPQHGCINLHASLLPRYRGAAPIQAAIAAGDEVTGVTSMKMSAGLDSGPILLQKEVAIGPEETTPELSGRLSRDGSLMIVETLRRLAEEGLEELEQDDAAATFAPRLSRADGEVDWLLSARQIYDRWRAFTPWPGTVASLRGKAVKIKRCRPESTPTVEELPGTVVAADAEGLLVACGAGSVLRLETLQRPDRSPVEAGEFVNGEHLSVGECFETEPQTEKRS